MKRIALIAALCIVHGALCMMIAQSYLVLTHADGTVSRFALTDKPVITFDGGTLTVSCGEQTLTTSMEGLTTTIEDAATAIAQTKTDNTLRHDVNFGHVRIEGLKSGDTVTVYSIDGKTLSTTQADTEGRAAVDLSAFGKGVLIVKTPTKSFKIKN